MVVINRTNKLYYPKACEKILEIEQSLLQILYDNDIKDRIIFPITSKLEVFDSYDDIKKEFLVDFVNSEEEIFVFNPEYFTVIKDYNDKYMKNIKDQVFYYIQQTLSYTSPERKEIKEDLVLGFVILNPSDILNSWGKIARTFTAIGRELYKETDFSFNNDYTLDASINEILIGFGRNKGEDGIMEAHFSLTDIYSVLSKM